MAPSANGVGARRVGASAALACGVSERERALPTSFAATARMAAELEPESIESGRAGVI
jgi:hypothetical protein